MTQRWRAPNLTASVHLYLRLVGNHEACLDSLMTVITWNVCNTLTKPALLIEVHTARHWGSQDAHSFEGDFKSPHSQ
jgi:hypothetical protein